MRNNSGKALAIFLVLIAVILVSLTAISVFLLIKQVQLRENAEYNLAQLQTTESTLRSELAEVKKQKELLEQKQVDAEGKIESLIQELDLAEGVRDEVKKENRGLKESVETLTKEKQAVLDEVAKKEQEAQQRVGELQEQLESALERNKTLEEKTGQLEKEFNELKAQLMAYEDPVDEDVEAVTDDVELPKIVVSGGGQGQGQIVSVDQDAEFVIVNLGERQGVAVDATLSVFDGESYLGDITVTKVLPEMSAADFVLPLTSQQVAEGNLVKVKE